MSQIAQRPQINFVLKVLNGPDKGSVYKLMSHSVKIGRETDNDIALSHDNKVSRNHAVISMGSQGVEVKNVSGRNVLVVDGKETQSAVLSPNSVIQLGDTKLQFNLNQDKGLARKSADLSGVPGGLNRPRKRKRQSQSGPSMFFWVALAVIGLLLWALLTTNTTKKDAKPEIRSDEDITNIIEENRQIADQVNQQKQASGKNDREYREAHAAYIKGFRDLQNGHYERALGHFQTCLAIIPGHELCGPALQNANQKFTGLIQKYLRQGYDHQKKNQFRKCKIAFRNVQIMVKDTSNDLYREAAAGYKACDARERERF